MKYSKTLKIKNKRIKKEDILYLSKIIEDEFPSDDSMLSFKINFWDDSSIADESSCIFSNSFFDRKRTKSISIECYDRSFNRRIQIELYDSTYIDNSKIEITSTEQLWHSSMIAKLEDFLRDLENQHVWAPLTNSSFLAFVILIVSAVLTYICTRPISSIINNHSIALSEPIQTLIIFFIFAVNLVLCVISAKYLYLAFPTIDFCFGPDHMNQSLKNRKAVTWCVATFLPSLLLYLLELLISV